jgi:hypothetical protein
MLYIGSDTLGVTPFDGDIDEVRIYNETLDAAQIATLAGGPLLTVSDLTAGGPAILSGKHLTPGGATLVAFSVFGGGRLPSVWGDVLLTPPFVLFASLTADSLGFDSLSFPVPPTVSGAKVWLQAFDLGALKLSNGVAETIR